MLSIYARHYHYLFVTLLVAMSLSFANASVVMTGSRIIYPAAASEHSIQLTNNDNFPNAVQVWLDSGDENRHQKQAKPPL